jgi:hypothetical protein
MVEPVARRFQSLQERWHRTVTVLRAPRVRIEVGGDERARATYAVFTARHPRVPITSAKRWGVALLRVPDSYDDYLSRGSRHLRRKLKHAQSAGYHYAPVVPQDHLEEILEVNRSAPTRQGRRMAERYVEREQVVREHEDDTKVHAILDSSGQVRAYAVTHDLGDATVFSKAIGHADALPQGVMYLLIAEVVRECIEARRASGRPTWLMYDTFWGASAGLAYFKERLGFRPFTVDWVWRELVPTIVEFDDVGPAVAERSTGASLRSQK